ncbi:hypothetical protein LOTGIDRAFT_155130 [Lottia gigantea]|uniref:Major facilitator superfamily (MFS) profile domain-containing protein n=1 Tax=Lottia gigantea TaxID=225164 RepID=V4B9K5_LOTGI|nr:hypothetical protein LOTGIDRAFT_155130 [Lottia gigantea]ESO85639.1 hypothetical protein LOTGIDRAFT_155130 [Lottia gigantea]
MDVVLSPIKTVNEIANSLYFLSLQLNSPSSLSESSHSVGSVHSQWRCSAFELPHNIVSESSPQLIIDSKAPFWTSKKVILAILCFFCCFLIQASRFNLSIAIVSMVDHSQDVVNITHTRALTVNTHECSNLVEERDSKGEFDWDKPLQGLILGAFFWGYCVLQSASGWICDRYGVKRVLSIAFSITTILCLVSPICARTSPYLFICLRIALGLFQDCVSKKPIVWSFMIRTNRVEKQEIEGNVIFMDALYFLSLQVILTSWIPPSEKSRLYGFAFSGICTFVWTVAWLFFASNSPQEHPTITEAELKYIELSLGLANNKTKKVGKDEIKWSFTSYFSVEGAISTAVFLIGLSYIGCDQQILAVALVTIAVAAKGISSSGFFINPTDIAPAYAGTILGISNSLATLPGVIAPYVVGVLTPNGTRDEWQISFYIAGGLFLLAAVFSLKE